MKSKSRSIIVLSLALISLVAMSGCDSGAQATPTATSIAAPSPQPTTDAITPTAQAGTPVSQALVEAARQAITQMAAGDFASVEANFDKTMQEKLPEAMLKTVWGQIEGQFGAYKGQTGTTTDRQQGYDIVVVAVELEKGSLNARFVFDKDGKITGLFFAPATQSTPPAYIPPPYVNQSAFTERDVKVGSGEWELPGTLSMPAGAGPFPAVVLVQGSGPQDRDETIGLNKPFRDLAWGLASQGVAVLRYDKRTLVYQQKMAAMVDKITVKEEVTDDALLALDLLKNTEGVDKNRVFLLGHSLGGYLVPMMVNSAPDLAGAIVMAGTTRPFEDVVLDQYTYLFDLDGKVTADEQKQLDELKQQVARVKDPNLSTSVPATDLPLGLPANYWLSIRGYDPAKLAASQKVPMLIMQGERDYQVTMVDLKGWQDALGSRSDVEFKTYPKANHIFKDGEGTPSPDDYNSQGHMTEQAVKDIGAWINGR
ncbi:MAG: DUF3887 domain-containing protein [Chloroflexota bacterium]